MVEKTSFVPSNISETRDDITRMLKAIRETQQKSVDSADHVAAPTTANFEQILSQARSTIEQVNQFESASSKTKEAYLSGADNVSITDVVMASQKSELATQALLTVRNKILEAYRQIMDMPV